MLIFAISCSNRGTNFSHENSEVDSLINKLSAGLPAFRTNYLPYLDSAIAGKKLGIKDKIRIFEYKAGAYNFHIKKPDSAELYADSMLLILKGLSPNDYPDEFTKAYLANGDAHFTNQKYNEAYTFYYKARQNNTIKIDSCARKEYSYRVAMILYRQEKYLEAKDNFKQAFIESQGCHNTRFVKFFREQELLNNIALSFYKAGITDSARFYYQKALDFISVNTRTNPENDRFNEMARGVIFGNLGDVLLKSGDRKGAADMFRKSVAINLHKGSDVNDAQLSYLKLATLFYEDNQMDSLNLALISIRSSLADFENKRASVQWHWLMWKYNDRKNNIAEAYKNLQHYNAEKEAYDAASKSIHEIDINKQLDIFERQRALQQAENDYKLKRVYIILFVVLLLSVISAALILWYNWYRSRKNVQQLQLLNQKINEQNDHLEITVSELEKNAREKDSILKLVAHDLRTPVASIPTLVQLIFDEKDENQKTELLQVIRSSCNSSINLINDILSTSTLGNKPMDKQDISIETFINDCENLVKVKVSEKKQKLLINNTAGNNIIRIDAEKMKRVISNLITNAVKFSPKGASITFSIEQTDHLLRLSVSDQGIGIPKEMQSQVFELNTSAKRKGTDGEKSYGLGLYICKQIVTAHGGKIWMESEVDEGTTFFIELPIIREVY
ncbi:MAG TPA: tetratricopeptide repeat-containing sensor histidine kinase [Sediminibacterium sp.]|nr:tetratricopeptide repeat-containing sensor histidine kinase [Sediminibacterium sp.]